MKIKGLYARGRQKLTAMNATEQAYAQRLELLLRAGEILWYKFEGVRLRLANEAWYKPDFIVMLKDGTIEVQEIKGHWREAAKVRIKTAADIYPFRFIAIHANKGSWEVEEF